MKERSTQELLEFDLEDIQFYYKHKEFFDGIEETARTKAQVKKAELYKGFMKEAPLNLYRAYASVRASVEELKLQNSYFIRDLYGI